MAAYLLKARRLLLALDLIYDRTQEDADLWLKLVTKLDSGGWSSLTDEEQALWLTALKGSYNLDDLKRVSFAVLDLSDRFYDLLYHIPAYRFSYGVASDELYVLPYTQEDVDAINPKTSWPRTAVVKDANMRQYLSDLRTLRSLIPLPADAPSVPPDMVDLTVDEANDIERLLDVIDDEITRVTAEMEKWIRDTASAWVFSSDPYSAEVYA